MSIIWDHLFQSVASTKTEMWPVCPSEPSKLGEVFLQYFVLFYPKFKIIIPLHVQITAGSKANFLINNL